YQLITPLRQGPPTSKAPALLAIAAATEEALMTTVKTFASLSLVLLVLLALPQSVFAVTVGNGTPASCTQLTLQVALDIAQASGGGTIRFRCGQAPITITLTAPVTVPNQTTVDGGNLVTLDGGGHSFGLVSVKPNTTVSLKNLSFRNGGSSNDTGAPAILNEGTLTIDSSTIS